MKLYYTCSTCGGYGYIDLDREQLYSLLRGYLYEELNCRDRIEIIKEWMDNDGCIKCPDCDGSGEIGYEVGWNT